MTALDPAGYQAALEAQQQLVHSLLADIAYLRRHNEQFTRLLLQRAGVEQGGEEAEQE